MNNRFCPDETVQQYFNSLPEIIQESLLQGGADFSNIEELRACVSHLTEQNNSNS